MQMESNSLDEIIEENVCANSKCGTYIFTSTKWIKLYTIDRIPLTVCRLVPNTVNVILIQEKDD